MILQLMLDPHVSAGLRAEAVLVRECKGGGGRTHLLLALVV